MRSLPIWGVVLLYSSTFLRRGYFEGINETAVMLESHTHVLLPHPTGGGPILSSAWNSTMTTISPAYAKQALGMRIMCPSSIHQQKR